MLDGANPLVKLSTPGIAGVYFTRIQEFNSNETQQPQEATFLLRIPGKSGNGCYTDQPAFEIFPSAKA
jgi:hypothetical protein